MHKITLKINEKPPNPPPPQLSWVRAWVCCCQVVRKISCMGLSIVPHRSSCKPIVRILLTSSPCGRSQNTLLIDLINYHTTSSSKRSQSSFIERVFKSAASREYLPSSRPTVAWSVCVIITSQWIYSV